MDPVWAALAEFWWIGPSVIGAGALGWLGLRGQRGGKARRLAYDASALALRTARQDAAAARVAVRVARAELARAQADRAAGRAGSTDVAAARRALESAQRETRAAAANLRARRAGLAADRVALNGSRGRAADPAALPLARVMADDDAVSARFLAYETDPARILAFPAMSDARVPETAAFLAELRTTRALRPASADARITPAQFGAYRDGVARLARAFDAAEAEAWRRARADGSAPAGPGPDGASSAPAAWVVSAQEIAQNLTQSVLTRGAEALARFTAARDTAPDAADPGGPGTAPGAPAPDSPRSPGAATARRAPKASADPTADARSASSPPPAPVWPIPSRTSRPPRQ